MIYKLVTDKLLKNLESLVCSIKACMGQPGGTATLDSTGNVPASQLHNASGGSSITLTTTGTSGASTLTSGTLNIPNYQGGLTLTTTGTSGASTLLSNTLNIPNYASGVTSFNTRTGAVVPTSGDYTFAQIGSTPTTLSGYGITNGQTTVTLTTTGTSGAATFVGGTLNIPTPPAPFVTSLTTTGSSGPSTVTSGALNIPQYVGSGQLMASRLNISTMSISYF